MPSRMRWFFRVRTAILYSIPIESPVLGGRCLSDIVQQWAYLVPMLLLTALFTPALLTHLQGPCPTNSASGFFSPLFPRSSSSIFIPHRTRITVGHHPDLLITMRLPL